MALHPLFFEMMSCRRGLSQRASTQGFTLIELILVIVMMGVLAVFVAPSFNSTDFSARGLHDQTLALLRYAQKSAIAKRRTVCVAFTATTVSLTVASLSTTTLTCDTALAGAGASSTVTARSGVQFSSFPAAFSFDALGAPSAAQSIQVSNNVTSAITVEAVTGYVHD